MAIVVYKCDTCKREKEYEQNPEGLERIQRCTITHGCRGKLFQVKVLQDYVRKRLPEQVMGLEDWRQRKVLYNHVQSVSRDEWIITHNLGTFAFVSVFVKYSDSDDGYFEIIPSDIIIIDKNTVKLKFDRSISGFAQLVARQSDPDLLNPLITKEEKPTLQQLSVNSDITIATRISTLGDPKDLNVSLRFTTTQNTVVSHTYVATSDIGGSNSPWRDYDKIILKGKIYTIRTFNGIFYPEMFDGTISSGSTFLFTTIEDKTSGSPSTFRNIEQDEVILLFANSPFDTIDKNTNQYVDVYDINDENNTFSLVYDNEEFFVSSDIIQDVYPPIKLLT